MQNACSNTLATPADADRESPTSLVGWLGDLLDRACDRGDVTLVRLIADVMDDLGAAAKR